MRFEKKRLATTCSPTVLTAVPSALEVLTTEFGMGSGVAPPLWLPAGKCWEENLVLKDKIARPNLVELVTCVLIIFFRWHQMMTTKKEVDKPHG